MAAVGVRAPLLCSFQSEFRIPRLRDVCSILHGRGEGLVEGFEKKKIKKKKRRNKQCPMSCAAQIKKSRQVQN